MRVVEPLLSQQQWKGKSVRITQLAPFRNILVRTMAPKRHKKTRKNACELDDTFDDGSVGIVDMMMATRIVSRADNLRYVLSGCV